MEVIDVDNPIWSMMGAMMQCVQPIEDTQDTLCIQDTEDTKDSQSVTLGGLSPCCSAPFEQSEGNVLCRKCFTLLDRQIDYGAEWRFYGADDNGRGQSNPTRCCPPSNSLLSQNLGSVISSAPRRQQSQWQNRTASSAAAADALAAAGKSIQKFQSWSSMSYKDRVLCGIFDGLAVNAAQHGLTTCLLEEAKTLYKRFSENRITRGENREAAIAASVYISCVNNGVTRSCKEVAQMFNVRPVALTKACRAFREVVRDTAAVTGTSTTIAAEDFVGRFCSRLNIDAVYVEEIRGVLRRADELSIACDSMPPSIAAGAIALVVETRNLPITRDQIGEASVVAATTVHKLMKKLEAGIMIPQET